MSEVNTLETTADNVTVSKVRPAKKAAAKKVSTKKAPAKKAAKKSAKKAAPVREKKEGLRKPQVRILKALAKKDGMNRNQIAEKAPVDLATCVEYLGSHDDDVRAVNDKKHFPSLITLGLVKAQLHDVQGKNVVQYFITAKGKTAAANN